MPSWLTLSEPIGFEPNSKPAEIEMKATYAKKSIVRGTIRCRECHRTADMTLIIDHEFETKEMATAEARGWTKGLKGWICNDCLIGSIASRTTNFMAK